jgi:hypothetical protein
VSPRGRQRRGPYIERAPRPPATSDKFNPLALGRSRAIVAAEVIHTMFLAAGQREARMKYLGANPSLEATRNGMGRSTASGPSSLPRPMPLRAPQLQR